MGKTDKNDNSETHNFNAYFLVGVIITIVPSLYFGYVGKNEAMISTIGAGALIMAFANIDKLESFAGFGFKAEMRKKIEEAYASIDKLQKLSIGLASPLMQLLTMQNRQHEDISLAFKFSTKNKIINSLKSLDIEQEMIDEICEFFRATFIHDYIWWLIAEGTKLGFGRESNDLEKFIIEKNQGFLNSLTFDEINNMVSDELKSHSSIQNILSDIKYYLQSGSIRREAEFQTTLYKIKTDTYISKVEE